VTTLSLPLTEMRLTCSEFWVDVRLRRVGGVWLASADTPDGPTLGWGDRPMDALFVALDPYRDVRPELRASIEHEEAFQ
jgi:hypothetical protein